MNAKAKKPVTLYDSFIVGEAQPTSHGITKGLDEVCRESSRRNKEFRNLVNTRRRNGEEEILMYNQARMFEDEEAADALYQVTNAFHQEEVIRAKGSPNIYHQKDVADLVRLFGGDIDSVITAYFHDNIEDLSKNVYEMDQYIINGHLNGKYPIPDHILPRVVNLSNMTDKLAEELIILTKKNNAYSLNGILDACSRIGERMESPEMKLRIHNIKDGIDMFWYNSLNELPKRNKDVTEKNRVKYVLEQVKGTFFNFAEHAKYLSGSPLQDIGVKTADRTENAGNDRFLTKDKSYRRIRSGGKNIIITDMIDKIPALREEKYFGIQVMKYVILERTFERFRRHNYANAKSRIELKNLPADEAAEKVWFYENMIENVLHRTEQRFQEIVDFKKSEKLLDYLKNTNY